MKIVEIANSVDPDEASHSELAHLHLQCFFCFFFLILYTLILLSPIFLCLRVKKQTASDTWTLCM